MGTTTPHDNEQDRFLSSRHNSFNMADSQVTLRTRKFIRNPLLGRRQMVVDVLHPNRPNVSKDELRAKLGELYKSGKDQVSVFGFRTHYGVARARASRSS